MARRALDARVAIVTGANSGIGTAIAVELARLGADVLAAYLRTGADAPGPDDVLAGVRAHSGRAVALEADLHHASSAALLFDTAERELGPVSVLVNNATGWSHQDTFSGRGVDGFGRPLEAVGAASFDANVAVDARAAALLMAELARRLPRDGTGGRIVSISSGGPGGFPSEVSYGAAKAALENLTMSAATELAPLGVTANVVLPPITDTGWVTDAVRRVAAEAGGRVAEPADVAQVVGWLCTDAARLVTGNRIRLR